MGTLIEPLAWNDQDEVYGFKVKSFFFDGAAAEQEDDYIKRNLPIFKVARPKVIATETDRRNFRIGNVVAQPDGVLEHGNGLLSLEFKPQGKKEHGPKRWQQQIPLTGMLQCMVAAIAVASETGKPTLPLLRCYNALYMLSPSPAVVSKVLKLFELAPMYWDDESSVASSRIAKLCEPWVRETFPDNGEEAQKRRQMGEELHEQFLRR